MTHFVTRVKPIDEIDEKNHKTLKAAEIMQPIIYHITSYLWPQGRTHTHIHSA